MKKMFKMTLFKKVFLIICLSMVVIECLHIYIDYKDEIKEEKQEIELLNRWDNNIYSIQSIYLEYNDINNPDFLKKIQDLERVGENNTLIVDLDLNIVNDNNYWQDFQAEQSHLIFSDDNKEHGFIDFKSITSDFYYRVKKVIYNYVRNNKDKCEIIIDSHFIDQDKDSVKYFV